MYDIQSKDGKEWFYSETVKEHFFTPRNFVKTREEAKRLTKESDGVGIEGSPACVTGNTLIHLNFNLKEVQILTKNHKVLSHEGTYNKITQFFNRKYTGDLIKIKNKLGAIEITPEHLIYAMQIPKKSTFVHNRYKRKIPSSWVHARDLKKGDICLYPIPKEVRKKDYIEIPITKAKFDFNSKSLPDKIPITNDLLRLCGYFVAEGNTRPGGKEISFTFGIKEKHFSEDVKKLIKKLFNLEAKIRIRKEDNKVAVLVYSTHLAKYFRENFGNISYNKHLPEYIMFLQPELQKSLLSGLWHGDGYINLNSNKPRAEFSTTSYILAHQIKLLLLRQKIQHSIYCEKEKEIKGVIHRKCYRIHVGKYDALKKLSSILKVKFTYPTVSRNAIQSWFDKNYMYFPIKKVEKIKFNGQVFNLEVDEAHSYVSDAFTLHNCGDMMKMWIRVKDNKIVDCKWQTFGCASAIASTSMFSTMITENGGLEIEKALEIKPQDIAKRLDGLPARKFHCSVLADKSLRAAINDYYIKTNQLDKIKKDKLKVIDKILKITDRDIEEAVLEGARTFEDLQKRTKIGIQDKSCIPEAEQLLRFYVEKHFLEEAK